jgi:methanogenic corrinoid protein MtbC1
VAEIADGPIQGAMAKIGELWQHSDAGIFHEHRATDIVVQAVQQLRAMVHPPEDGPVAVGGAPPGDPYLLPTLLSATALAAEGFQAINIGADTPIGTLRIAAEEHRASLIWLSVSHIVDGEGLARDTARLVDSLSAMGAKLVVGGRCCGDFALKPDESLYVGRSMAELLAFANGMLFGRSTSPAEGAERPK